MKNGTTLGIKLMTEMSQDGQKETHHFDVIGEGVVKNNSLYLFYDEEHQVEKETVKIPVMIKIASDGTVDLTRTAGSRSKLKFSLDQGTTTHYQTPYGLMALEVTTELIEHHAENTGLNGHLVIAYQLAAEQGVLGDYRLTLDYQEITI